MDASKTFAIQQDFGGIITSDDVKWSFYWTQNFFGWACFPSFWVKEVDNMGYLSSEFEAQEG
jgi:hypothetical protein